MYQQTSMLAYRQLKKDGLNHRQIKVLEALEEIAPATNRQLAKYLNWEINTVTPRVLELRGKRKVEEAYRDMDVTGRTAIFWKPKSGNNASQ